MLLQIMLFELPAILDCSVRRLIAYNVALLSCMLYLKQVNAGQVPCLI